MIDLDRLIAQAHDLEPLPATTTRLAAVAADPEAGLREVVELVSFDQALTARLLRYANSATVASREPVTSVSAAVNRVGTGTVLALAMSSAVKVRLHEPLPAYGLTEGDLWRHSVACALAVDSLVRVGKLSVPPGTFSAALLHDLGKLVLARFLDDEVLTVLREAREQGGLTELQAEVEVLSVHHAELGGLIARDWDLPESIVDGITHHHDADPGDDRVGAAVHLADMVAHAAAGAGAAERPGLAEALDAAASRLGIAPARLDLVRQAVSDGLEERVARYS